jgi:hypothetical protein
LYATPYHSDGVVHHTPDDAIKDDEHLAFRCLCGAGEMMRRLDVADFVSGRIGPATDRGERASREPTSEARTCGERVSKESTSRECTAAPGSSSTRAFIDDNTKIPDGLTVAAQRSAIKGGVTK